MECGYEREHSIPVDRGLAPPVISHRSATLVADARFRDHEQRWFERGEGVQMNPYWEHIHV
jgi:hypothetical protein